MNASEFQPGLLVRINKPLEQIDHLDRAPSWKNEMNQYDGMLVNTCDMMHWCRTNYVQYQGLYFDLSWFTIVNRKDL